MRIGIDCRKIADYGIGTYIRGLLGAFVRVAQDETFVLFGPPAIDASLPAALRAERVIADAPHYSMRELPLLGIAERRARLDVFHAPHYVLPFVSAPAVVTIHDLIHLRIAHRNPLRALYARGMIGRAVRKSAAIVTVSEAARADIERDFPASRGKIDAIPNGVLPLFGAEPRGEDDAVLASFGLERRGYFLWVGNDKPHKRLDLLLGAWGRARPHLGSMKLCLAGPPAAFEREDGVVRAGRVSDDALAALYRGALALVLASDHEGFGLPVAEAMASGTPVICSDIPPLREVAGGAARYVAPGDEGSLARALVDARATEASRAIAEGLRRAEALTWERAAERTLAVYRRVARRPGA